VICSPVEVRLRVFPSMATAGQTNRIPH
jgi:hypothetical protein